MGTHFDLAMIEHVFVEAAVDPTKWNDAMNATAAATDCFGALLFDSKTHLPDLPHSLGMERPMEAYICGGWMDHDVRYGVTPYLARKGVATDFDLFTPEQIASHPYYQDFLAPLGLRWFAGVKVASGSSLWCLSLQRAAGQLPFSEGELDDLHTLSMRLGTAAAVSGMLGFARASAALEAFEMSDTAAVALDGRGFVLTLNASAERMLGKAFEIVDRRLCSHDRNATNALERALSRLLLVEARAGASPPIAFPRRDLHPLLVYVLSLKSVTFNALAPSQAIAVFLDPEARRSPAQNVLRTCFQFTPAEAKLAQQLAAGRPLDEVAMDFGISYETARNQLRCIFDKTGSHRQPELVSLLSRLCHAPESELVR